MFFDSGGFSGVNVSSRDVFTLAGPAGTVDITIHFSGEASASRGANYFSGAIFGGGFLGVRVAEGIGGDGRTLLSNLGTAQEFLPTGAGPLSANLSADLSIPFTVTANTPFPLAFQLLISGTSAATVNALGTATIGFDVPDGYTLTSEQGWTPVPEPSTGLLMALGLGGLGLWSGRPARTRSPLRRRRRAGRRR